jgi:hypothetical protein
MAVMMPTGNWDGAMMVLANISAKTKKVPPSKAEAGNKNF